MSAYGNHPRVKAEQHGEFAVTMPGIPGDEVTGWVDQLGPGDQWRSYITSGTVASRDALGQRGWQQRLHDTADDAIRSLIGDPQ